MNKNIITKEFVDILFKNEYFLEKLVIYLDEHRKRKELNDEIKRRRDDEDYYDNLAWR